MALHRGCCGQLHICTRTVEPLDSGSKAAEKHRWSNAGRHNPGAASFDFRALLPLQQLSTLAVMMDHDGAVGALAGKLFIGHSWFRSHMHVVQSWCVHV
jgi:hypothetical protein